MPTQLKTYFSPSLTPQGPARPINEPISGSNKAGGAGHIHAPSVSNSGGNFDMRPGGSSTSEQRRLATNSNRTTNDAFANSFIHGRKVDSPKIFRG